MNLVQTTPQLGDLGFPFEQVFVDATGEPIDISQATTIEFRFSRADGSPLHVAGAFTTDGRDGSAVYLSQVGDLNSAGDWRFQVRLVIPPDFERSTTPVGFKVGANVP